MPPAIAFISRYGSAERDAWIARLASAMPDERIVAFDDLSETDRQATEIAIVANPEPEKVRCLENLKWIHSLWAGVEGLVTELGQDAPPIVRLIDPNMSHTMAEAVLTWCLYLSRDIPAYRALQMQKLWKPLPYRPATSLRVGILGLGTLGQAAAKMLKTPGFQLVGWSRSPKQVEGVACLSGEEGLEILLGQSDIVVCLLPLTDDTRGLLNKKRFSQMKQGAALINFARGPIIESGAMLDALEAGHISHAVLDVFNKEPLPDTCPYWHHPNITLLPHVAAVTLPESAVMIVKQNVAAWRQSGKLPQTVDMIRGY